MFNVYTFEKKLKLEQEENRKKLKELKISEDRKSIRFFFKQNL